MISPVLVQKLWNYCNILRDDGLSYGDYVEPLTFLLLKMADEQARSPFNPTSSDGLRRDGQAACRVQARIVVSRCFQIVPGNGGLRVNQVRSISMKSSVCAKSVGVARQCEFASRNFQM